MPHLQVTHFVSFSSLVFVLTLAAAYTDLAAQLSHISIQGVTSGQEASTEEASHKHNDIKRLLARSPRTRR